MKRLPDSKTLILNVLKTFTKEAKRKHPVVSFAKPTKRAAVTLGLSRFVVHRIAKGNDSHSVETTKIPAKEKGSTFDSFNIHIIRTAVSELISQNKTIHLKSLIAFLKEKKDLTVTKYRLWKTLHKIGFKYGRIERRTMGLMERADLVKKRISFLRTIKRHRESGKPIVYLDETWVDTHTYPKYQWLAPEGEQQRKLPAGRGQRFVILHCGSEKGFLDGCDLVFQV